MRDYEALVKDYTFLKTSCVSSFRTRTGHLIIGAGREATKVQKFDVSNGLTEKGNSMVQWFLLATVLFQNAADNSDDGLFVQALRLVQAVGTDEAASPENDRSLKSTLAKTVRQREDRVLAYEEVKELIDPQVFRKLAGDDGIMTAEEIATSLNQVVPKSRTQLIPELREHAAHLATTYDMISESHLESSRQLAHWLAKNYSPPKQLHVIIVCTGNSRRSILGSSMGNLAAAYHGLDGIHFHSGGTAPTAFNRRTVDTLKAIGFDITPTGAEAERGESKTANPKYRVAWGSGLETIEFSKRYSDSSNPASGFAAVMVCSEADNECPSVPGAAFRLSLPFLDPKSYDDSKYEATKYAERRDDIGRTLMAAMAIACRKINAGD